MTTPARPLVAAVLVLAFAQTLTGCARPGDPITVTTPPRTPPATKVTSPAPDPEAILDSLTAQLRSDVDGLAKIPPSKDNRVGEQNRTSCRDEADAEWPKYQTYSRGLLLEKEDSRPAAEQMISTLQDEGWAIDRDQPGASSTESRVGAQKNGFVIDINSGATGGGLVILGATPCVDQDGTVDRSPVS
jgi:hypothetical protein